MKDIYNLKSKEFQIVFEKYIAEGGGPSIVNFQQKIIRVF